MALVAGGLDALDTAVGDSAVEPDLALAAGEQVHVAHLHHGFGELLEECPLVEREPRRHARGVGVDDEALVRLEQTLLGNEIKVVLVVEHVRRTQIEGLVDGARRHVLSTLGPQLGREIGVDD
uniref:Uncharacterized protein n=1 Tax=Triticum urartu TaxID=4572 RepID=A0A8R7PKZ9_TRIUA